MLCVCRVVLKTFTLEVRDKDKALSALGLTGKEFFEKYVGWTCPM
ncbi:MAG: hypothetical protein ACLULM_04170 [Acutalibacter sp.]